MANSLYLWCEKCPKVFNMIRIEMIWQEVLSEKPLDLQGFYGVT